MDIFSQIFCVSLLGRVFMGLSEKFRAWNEIIACLVFACKMQNVCLKKGEWKSLRVECG
jgi:hypothetical protein